MSQSMRMRRMAMALLRKRSLKNLNSIPWTDGQYSAATFVGCGTLSALMKFFQQSCHIYTFFVNSYLGRYTTRYRNSQEFRCIFWRNRFAKKFMTHFPAQLTVLKKSPQVEKARDRDRRRVRRKWHHSSAPHLACLQSNVYRTFIFPNME